MESLPLIILVVLGVPIVVVVWLIVRAFEAKARVEELARRLARLELEFFQPKEHREFTAPVEPVPEKPAIFVPPLVVPPEPIVPLRPVMPPHIKPVSEAPPVFAPLDSPQPPPPPPNKPAVNWEQFMGVKGFAWIGGFTFFLGVVLAIQYSFAHHLISQSLQAAFGFLTGLGVLVGGVVMSRKNYPALSQTLCATGVLILYAETFACRSHYHFEFFGTIPTFLMMALITVTAFLLAVRLKALVVAILGMLGGFLTPILLSTGQDNPLGLFGYIVILDAGLILVALHRRWFFLAALGALGTAIMQVGWVEKFFIAQKYFEGNKILIALAVLLGFNALYLAASWAAKTWNLAEKEEPMLAEKTAMNIRNWLFGSTLGLVIFALALTAWFLGFKPLAQRPWLMFGFVFLIDLVVLALVLADESVAVAQSIAGLAVFGLLGFWTAQSLTQELLNAALAFYFIFAVVHSALPELLRRRHGQGSQVWAIHIFPLLALGLVLAPIFKLTEISFIVWPFILLVDVLAIALAVLTGVLFSVLAVLLLTLAATGALIFKIPSDLTGLPVSLFLLGAFVVFFVALSIWLVRRFKPGALKEGIQLGDGFATAGEVAAILPACSVVLPFLLLIMATMRLPLVNPSPVFGLALLLVVLLLGLTRLYLLYWMPAIGLACVGALECAWHFNHFDPGNPHQPLNLVVAWYVVFFALFAVFPFFFVRPFTNKAAPWAAAAMAGPLQFFLIHRFVSAVYPNPFMGLLPAAFAVPGLLSLVVILEENFR